MPTDKKGFMDSAIGYLRTLFVGLVAGAILCCAVEVPAQTSAMDSEKRTIRIVDSIDETRLVTLTGSTHPLARAAYDTGRVSPDLAMGDLVLVLRRDAETQAAFDQFVASQYNVKSPNFHQWLTPEEVGEKFGPAEADIDTVSNWLIGRGFVIDEVSKDRLSIRFSGTAAQVETAFHTEIHNLDVKGEQHVANMTDAQIPTAIAPVVAGVKALHNFFPRPLHRLGSQVELDRAAGTWQRVGGPNSVPTRRPGQTAPTGIRPQFGTVDSYDDVIEDVAPYDFATIYNVLPLWKASTPIDGTGQTIAIAGRSNIHLTDVASFRSAFGLPAKAPTVVITNSDPGACPGFLPSCADDLIENTLDVEWAGAVAKGANIVLVTSSAPTPTSDPLYLSEKYIVGHKTAPVMNVSYGSCELVLGTAGNTEYNNLWQSAAAEGIAVFVASGDAGSPACDQGFDAVYGVPYPAEFGLAVNGIGSTPYNTAVGGTDLNWGATAAPYWSASVGTGLSSATGYIPEVPWNSTCVNPLVLPSLASDAAYIGVSGVVDAESACNFVIESGEYIQTNFGVNLAPLVDTIGGGGGASNCTVSLNGNPESCTGHYAKPSWQAGVQGIPADGARDVPDVAFFASNGFLGSSYLICVAEAGSACTYSATEEPTAQEVGGTSVASPAMAGVMALINQRSGGSQGNPNSVLYELAARERYANCSAETVKATSTSCIFNDIDTGTNAMACVNPELQESPNCAVKYAGDPAGILTGFSAGTGYDEATGLGSLNVANAVNSWPSIAPYAAFSATELTFAATSEGFASASQTVTLKNSGMAALSLSGTGRGITITGTYASSFVQTNTCGTSVAAGASCTVTVIFKPAAIGALRTWLSFADNAFGSPQAVTLHGTGVTPAPVAKLSAQTLSFNSTTVGSTNTAPSITLTNSGTAALAITSIGFTGTDATAFTETNTCGTGLAIGKSCGIVITFKPKAAGTLTATLDVKDNEAGSPQTLAVSGVAVEPAVRRSTKAPTFASTAKGTAAGVNPQIVGEYGRLPLRFEANEGQTDGQVKFLARGSGFSLFLTGRDAVLSLRKPGEDSATTHVVRMQLSGAKDDTEPEGLERLPGISNYMMGNDLSGWHTNVPNYGRVRYAGVYPGVNLVYYGNGQRLEYDFQVAAGADPRAIRLKFDGAQQLRLDADGDLEIVAADGQIAFQAPVVYQKIDGRRQSVAGKFKLLASNAVGFELGAYDRSESLTIDPTLVYSTYLGGSNSDTITAIAVDGSGNAYLTGYTSSTDFPVTPGAYQTTDKDAASSAFVTKLNSSGSALIYSTFLGGTRGPSGGDSAQSIAVDLAGDAYVTGYTYSSNFPTTTGVYQTTNNAAAASGSNSFVTKLNPTGTGLLYSTYLGGNVGDDATSIAIDTAGDAYVAGVAFSANYPTTTGAYQTTNKGAADYYGIAFVTKLNPTASGLVYSTFVGGSTDYISQSIVRVAINSAGDAYLFGVSGSTDFPVTTGAYQGTNKGIADGGSNLTLTELNSTATKLVYSTYLGGSGAGYRWDAPNGLAIDSAGDAYLTGITYEANFPVTTGAFQKTNNAAAGSLPTCFVTKMNPTGTALAYSTFLGGSGSDRAVGIAVDSAGDAYITGSAGSTDFPVTSNAYQTTNLAAFNNGAVVFLTELNPAGSAELYSTYFGGGNSFSDIGNGVALGANGAVLFAGVTGASDFPITSGAYEKVFNSTNFSTGFVSEFTFSTGPATAPTATLLTSSENPATAGTALTFTAAVTPATGTVVPTGNVIFNIDQKNVATVALNSLGYASYTISTLTNGQHAILASYQGSTTYSASGGNIVESITALTPVISPGSGIYHAAQLVTITDSTASAVIHYTTNGSAPGTSTTAVKYAGPFVVSTGVTVQAVAELSGAPNSNVAGASYQFINAPTVLAVPASAVSTPNATLNALVNTYGMSGSYYFVYGTSPTALTRSTPATPLAGSSIGSRINFVPVAVSAKLTSLVTKTTYYFQVVVTTPAGASAGIVLGFTTN